MIGTEGIVFHSVGDDRWHDVFVWAMNLGEECTGNL